MIAFPTWVQLYCVGQIYSLQQITYEQLRKNLAVKITRVITMSQILIILRLLLLLML